MIKRKYEKPRVLFENFKMGMRIAACESYLVPGPSGPDTNGVYDENFETIIFDTDIRFSVCQDDFDCYHTPNAGDTAEGTASMVTTNAS